ncbi:MAG: hypothetical protein H0T42_08480 [Deltaproteobacteria bacterium]|nr:hypothetical protein [Deltaproteobacteria bacterium]
MRPFVLYALILAAGCGGARPLVDGPRYANQPIVWRVNDRLDVPKPAVRLYARTLYHIDGFVVRRLTRLMDVRDPVRATNVNALDEVPDSTWFTNRIGIRDLALEEIRRGPNRGAGPENHKPWTIKGSKVGGLSIGFIMKDAEGGKYLLKFDHKQHPLLETAADVIGQRILWACGYNVPEDNIVQFTRGDLVLAPDAVNKGTFGPATPLTASDLDARLAKINMAADGTTRGLASKFLGGVPVGPFSREGVRADDPNDLIPHEQRRELRGQVAIFAWLNHSDIQEDQTLDMWVEDPRDPKRHYIVHHILDFGKAIGVSGRQNEWQYIGHAEQIDFDYMFRSLLSFGLWKRPWEDVVAPKLPGVGLFDVASYNPGAWRTNSQYWPFKDADRFDAFWGAKLIMRFTREQLEAIVDEARLPDPAARAYLVDTLVARQRATAAYWFKRVNPLDAFTVERAGDAAYRLCFDDLTIRYDLDEVGRHLTRYKAEAADFDGKPTTWTGTAPLTSSGRTCMTGIQPAKTHDGYTIVRIWTLRGALGVLPTQVHLAIAPETGALRVIGVHRE